MATKELLEDSFPKLKHSSDRLFVFGLRVERKDDDLWSMKVKYYFDENGDIKFVPGFKYQVKK